MKITCKTQSTSVKEIKVTVLYMIILSVVFFLQSAEIINKPCNHDFESIYLSNFFEPDMSRLSVDLFSLYNLSSLELLLGSQLYFIFINSVLIFNSYFNYELQKLNPETKCITGFSGILFSMITFNVLMTKMLNLSSVLAITFIIIIVALKNSTLRTYSIGAISGIILSLIFKFFGNKILIQNLANST